MSGKLGNYHMYNILQRQFNLSYYHTGWETHAWSQINTDFKPYLVCGAQQHLINYFFIVPLPGPREVMGKGVNNFCSSM